ncbi:hypothetical protein BDQ94DRAFT_17718 [Aspergillus welwitschiae]|uniref:Uncharacterized protein n=1 Tax=Aspergillus welwitschiae TaxID=1341132 RepID=A0A3F3PHR0_9EURO|nr:hypothetical protein BDQ94DRAFT_17718 [Aspergillus welwitschiae]RDH26490.1 hypothetical protein BDQ94DRAFT_17718 [Aspergillus welwitschiae]
MAITAYLSTVIGIIENFFLALSHYTVPIQGALHMTCKTSRDARMQPCLVGSRCSNKMGTGPDTSKDRK